MLLHGLTCNAAYWVRVVPLLTGLRVIALDFRGHGLSEHRESYRYADYEDDHVTLLDGFGLEGVVVAGHSLGGYVALSAATGTDRIRGIVAIDVKSDWTATDAELAERSRHASQRVEPDRKTLLDRLERTLQPVVLTDDQRDTVGERSIEQLAGGSRFRWDRQVLATEPVDPFGFLSDVPCRVVVMAGFRSDVMPPASAERFAAAVPGAVLEVVDRVGHHVELEPPARIAASIRDLAATGLSAGRRSSGR